MVCRVLGSSLIQSGSDLRPFLLRGRFDNGRHVDCVGRIFDHLDTFFAITTNLIINFFLKHREFNDTVFVSCRMAFLLISDCPGEH